MTQCLGRLVSMEVRAQFDGGLYFHLPLRCQQLTKEDCLDGLCRGCTAKEEKTRARVAESGGKFFKGHEALLHGRITEPIPYWSHLYDGAWFRLKQESGLTLSEETMGKVKAAVDAAQGSIDAPAPEIAVTNKRGRKPKAVEAAAAVEKAVEAVPAAAAVPVEKPKRTRTKRAAGAAVAEEPVPVLGIVLNPKKIDVEEIIEVEVEPITLEDHQYYIHWPTKKVYNLKCRYLGRLTAIRTIDSSFPDSDAE